MHISTVLTSGLLLAGFTLVNGQYDYGSSGSGSGYGSSDTSAPQAAEEGMDSTMSSGGDAYGAGYGEESSSWDESEVAEESAVETIATPAATAVPASESAVSPTGSDVMVHVVSVGSANGSLTFSPADIRAAQGDMVQFQFYPKNHSVVQSTFDQPCQPIANNQPGTAGIFSGFMPVSADSSEMPTYTFMVNDTKPIWFYCSQGKHCQQGMVGVINPPAANTSRTLESHKKLASGASENLSPGQTGGASNSTGTSPTSSPGSESTTLSTVREGATGSGSNSGSRANSTSPAAATGTNGVGSIRMDGARGTFASLAAAGLVALFMSACL